jgi:hypothetical protein
MSGRTGGETQTLAAVGLNEPELAGGGWRKRFPKPRVLRLELSSNRLIYGQRMISFDSVRSRGFKDSISCRFCGLIAGLKV